MPWSPRLPPTCSTLTEFGSKPEFLNFQQFACADAADGGCDCSYLYDEGSTEMARYETVGSQLLVVDSMSLLPPRAYDYCVQGDTLTLGGHNGIRVFGSRILRSVVATRCPPEGCPMKSGSP